MGKELNLQIEKAQCVPERNNQKMHKQKYTSKYFLNSKINENIVHTSGEKEHVSDKDRRIRLASDFSCATLQVTRKSIINRYLTNFQEPEIQ